MRVLDSFGTHAEFNSPSYFKKHKAELGGKSNPWGGNRLELQQFMTMYPHTDDNTFLGFVVETHHVNEQAKRDNTTLVLFSFFTHLYFSICNDEGWYNEVYEFFY